MIAHVLALDIAGNPFGWIAAQDAVIYYATGKVAWELGGISMVFRGGYQRSGLQSRITVKPIIAIVGSEHMTRKLRRELPLGNQNYLLFKRDRYTCAYCGNHFGYRELSRDHILPRVRGGKDTWMNCVTACRRCNQEKGDKLVEHFRPLLYVPYVPCRAEHYLLSGRNVLADQHDYLAAQLPKHSRLLC
ncbi:MAG TPA: HNH endonuclease [Noviherbaspirillum sp.]|uniref:HNH endonuclease n=1 Tax=Noviherbaspirillum sp. TaxID=1926288 RepID=UPI002B48553C|nr:HNH endonuclease [Noviherbaspirillum sp.]HJV87543.1 HNH endonuclease [Noviherbaspirillum sp.]